MVWIKIQSYITWQCWVNIVEYQNHDPIIIVNVFESCIKLSKTIFINVSCLCGITKQILDPKVTLSQKKYLHRKRWWNSLSYHWLVYSPFHNSEGFPIVTHRLLQTFLFITLSSFDILCNAFSIRNVIWHIISS